MHLFYYDQISSLPLNSLGADCLGSDSALSTYDLYQIFITVITPGVPSEAKIECGAGADFYPIVKSAPNW